MKALKYSLLGLLLVLVVACLGLFLYLEPLVKTTVNTVGTKIVGTQVNLDGFRFSPFVGEAEITGLSVANPEGYKTPNLINLGRIFVKVDVKSLLTDTIIVDEVSVNGIELTYEMPDLSTSNVMQIQQNIAKNTASPKTSDTQEVKTEVKEVEDSSDDLCLGMEKVLLEVETGICCVDVGPSAK